MPVSDSDKKAQALGELGRLIDIRANVAAELRVQARVARKAGNKTRASKLSSLAIRLNQQNFRILHARRKLHAAVSVGPALKRMKKITAAAVEVETALRNNADLLKKAKKLVKIIIRLSV